MSRKKLLTGSVALAGMLAIPGLAQVPAPPPAPAYKPAVLKKVGIVQKMGAQVPMDVPFMDENGNQVTLRQYLGKPVILALVYYQCPSLCDMVLNGLVRTAQSIPLKPSQDYDIVAVSFDPHETPEMARAKKASYMKEFNRPGTENGWHFLTGPEASSKALADAVGFSYTYDSMTNQWAHASGIILLTPLGKVTRYFYGIQYPGRDVRLSLVEASKGKIGSAVDQVLLYCYHYDPANGKYGLVIMNVLRLGGILTLLCLGMFLFVNLRRDFRAKHAPVAHGGTT